MRVPAYDGVMKLTDEQKQKVSAWISEGLKLADIQKLLAEQFDVRLTYMEARFLMDDLQLTPKDAPQETPAAPAPEAAAAEPAAEKLSPDDVEYLPPDAGNIGGKVSLTVDTLARPGTLVSGKVTFTDGITAAWYLDQTGRLGVGGADPGYRPPTQDVAEFQRLLDAELMKLGF